MKVFSSLARPSILVFSNKGESLAPGVLFKQGFFFFLLFLPLKYDLLLFSPFTGEDLYNETCLQVMFKFMNELWESLLPEDLRPKIFGLRELPGFFSLSHIAAFFPLFTKPKQQKQTKKRKQGVSSVAFWRQLLMFVISKLLKEVILTLLSPKMMKISSEPLVGGFWPLISWVSPIVIGFPPLPFPSPLSLSLTFSPFPFPPTEKIPL